LLNDLGIERSKRQVIQVLTQALDGFHAEDAAVLHAGLVSAPLVTVDETGARHASRDFHTTQIGGEYFTAFRRAPSKSRLNFLALLRGNYQDYVLNDAPFSVVEERQVDPALLAPLNRREPRRFASQVLFREYLAASGIEIFDRDIIRAWWAARWSFRMMPGSSGLALRRCGTAAAQAGAGDAAPSEACRDPARAYLAPLRGSEKLSAKSKRTCSPWAQASGSTGSTPSAPAISSSTSCCLG
jgi:hypothetical protein